MKAFFIDYFYKKVGMKGWVTWLSSTGLIFLGFLRIYQGDIENGLMLVGIAGGLIGLGRKTEKTVPIDELVKKE